MKRFERRKSKKKDITKLAHSHSRRQSHVSFIDDKKEP